MTPDPHMAAVGVITLVIPVCVIIILLLREKRSYRRAVIGGAVVGAAWRIPCYVLTLIWLHWQTGMDIDGVGLPPLNDFIASAFLGAVLGTAIVSVWKATELVLRKVRLRRETPQP